MNRQRIEHLVGGMSKGQCLNLSADDFERAYRDHGWPSPYDSAIESFLGKQIGSSTGFLRVEKQHTLHHGWLYRITMVEDRP